MEGAIYRGGEGIRVLRKTVSAIMLSLLVISTLTLAFNIKPVKASGTTTTGSPWPMFFHDPQHTVRSPYLGPQTNDTRWVLTSPIFAGGTLVDIDGTLYLSGRDELKWGSPPQIYAIREDGTLKWNLTIGSYYVPIPIPSTIASDGTIYAKGSTSAWFTGVSYISYGHILYAINLNGTIKWIFDHTKFISLTFFDNKTHTHFENLRTKDVNIDQTGLIFFSVAKWSGTYLKEPWTLIEGKYTYYLFSVNPDGTVRWMYTFPPNLEAAYPFAIGHDGNIYMTPMDRISNRNNLTVFAPDGSMILNKRIGWGTWLGSPAIGSDGTIYVNGVTLSALTSNGTMLWERGVIETTGYSVNTTPIITNDSVIVLIHSMPGYRGAIRAFDFNGNTRWIFYFEIDTGTGQPIADRDGNVYFSAIMSEKQIYRTYALYSNGTLRWTYNCSLGSFAIGFNNTLYALGWNGLYAISPGPPPPPAHVRGIDVSHYQEDINWSEVYGAGYRFAFVKASEGVGWMDPKFITNMDNGRDAGLLMGAYHFARPDLGNEAADEARYFVSIAGEYLKGGYLRPALDLERGSTLGKEALTNWVHIWMETVKGETGIEPIIYVNSNYANNYLDVSAAKYNLWIAHWTYDPSASPNTGIWDSWDFWQYSDKGSVPGISGYVDLDLFNGDMGRLYDNFVTPTPTQPPQPVNLSPPDGATDVSLEPTLCSSPPLQDVEPDLVPWEEIDGIPVTKVYCQWQITTVSADYSDPVYNLTILMLIDGRYFPEQPEKVCDTVDPGVLDYGTTYYWRVRQKDFRDVWSPWSEETSFTTKESREMKIARLITQEAIGAVPVTVEGQFYFILTLKSYIDPITLEVTPDVLTNVYLEAGENYPLSDPETARKIGIIDYTRQIAQKAEEIRGNKEALMELRDIYLMLSSSDLAIAATNLGVSGVKLIKDMKTISDVLKNIETIKHFSEITVPRSLAGFFTKTLELTMRKFIYDPMKELGSDLRSELSQAIRDYTSALELLEMGEITDYSVARSFLSSYLSAKAHEDHAKYLFEKILRNYLLIVDELYKPVAALATWGLSNFVFLVKEAMDSFDWTVELLQRQIIASYENFATMNFKLLAHSRYTLELANVPSELIHELEIKYLNYVAEGYKEAAEAVERVITPMIPFFMKISLGSPAELRVYDSQGRVTGVVNGEEKIEIPYSAYYENTVILSSDDFYYYEVAGTEEGSYGLEMEKVAIENGESITFTATNIPISANAVHQYAIDWDGLFLGEEGVAVMVDSDGDGVFEHTFTSDSELTQSEYVAAINAINTWITDSDFNEIESFRVVFTPHRRTGQYKLTATNPGQFYLNILVNNTWPEPLNITIVYLIDANFTFKGAKPIHVYADLNKTIDITANCTFSDNKITVYNVAPNTIIYVTIHLDYALKGTTWTGEEVEAWYSEHAFNATVHPITSQVVITDPELQIPPIPLNLIFLVVVVPMIILCLGLILLLKYAPLIAARCKED